MKNLKKIIIILFIILIIIFIFVYYLNDKVEKDNEEKNIQEYFADISGDFIKDLSLVGDYRTFFSVEEMLKKFIEEVEKRNQQCVYNLIDETYIAERNITIENVLQKISDIDEYASKVRIRKIYSQENEENAVYYIDCILEKENKGKQSYFVLYKDQQNITFSVAPLDKETYNQKINDTNEEIQKKEIQKNEDNKSLYINPTEKERVTKYFEDLLANVLYYPEHAYNLLNEQYRHKYFPSLQDFKDYIKNKRQMLESYYITNQKSYDDFENMDEYLLYLVQKDNLELAQYQIRYKDGYKKYICVDSEGNYYIFNAISPLNYTVILDNYTIPTDDFVKQYEESSEAEKVILNIKRFFMGIDDKNYGFSYSVLSESFKNSKYPTKNDFVNYAKQNFFEENKLEYTSYEKENGVYIYKINLTDATGKSSESKEFNIILKLKSGTDFEMSFGEN